MLIRSIKVEKFPELKDIEIDMIAPSDVKTSAVINHRNRLLYSTFTFAHIGAEIRSQYHNRLMHILSYLPTLSKSTFAGIFGDKPFLETKNKSKYSKIVIEFYPTGDFEDLYKYQTFIDTEGFKAQKLYKLVSSKWHLIEESLDMSSQSILKSSLYSRILMIHHDYPVLHPENSVKDKSGINPHSEVYFKVLKALESADFCDYLITVLILTKFRENLTRRKLLKVSYNEDDILLYRNGYEKPVSLLHLSENCIKQFLFISALALSIRFSSKGRIFIANEVDNYLPSDMMRMVYSIITNRRYNTGKTQFLLSIGDAESIPQSTHHPIGTAPILDPTRLLPPPRN